MEENKKIEGLLTNIENLTEEEKYYLKEELAPRGYIRLLPTIYNKLDAKQLSLMIEKLELEDMLDIEFVSIIEKKENLPVIPYSYESRSYYRGIFFTTGIDINKFLSNDTFYLKFNTLEMDYVVSLLEILTEEEQRQLFLTKCLEHQYIVPYTYSSSEYYKYMFQDETRTKIILSNDQFYSEINSTYYIQEILNIIPTEELKKLFLNKCLEHQKIGPCNYANLRIYEYMFQDETTAKTILSGRRFYAEINGDYEIEEILNIIPTEELKKIFANNCFSYISSIIQEAIFIQQSTEITKYVSSEIIIELMKKQETSDKILLMYRHLDDESKDKVYHSKWFKEKVDVNHGVNKLIIIESSSDKLIEELLNDNPNYKVIDFLIMFKEKRKVIFFKKFLDKVSLNYLENDFYFTNFIETIFSITTKNFEQLQEYQNKLIDLINQLPDEAYITKYFEKYMTFKFQSIELKTAMYNKAKNILQNSDIIINNISKEVLKTNDTLLLELVINNIPKEDLLLLSVRNEYINNYVLELLKKAPDYFKNIRIDDIDKYPMFSQKKDENLERKYLFISNYLEKEQLKIYFISHYIEQEPEIKKYYIEEVRKNPNTLSSLSDLKLFEEAEIKEILSNINIKELVKLLLYKPMKLSDNLKDTLKDNLSFRIYELASFINDETNELFISMSPRFESFLNFIKEDSLKQLINSINNYSFLCRYLNFTFKTSNVYNLLIDRLVNLYNSTIEITPFTELPYFFDEKEIEISFFNKLSFDVIINMVCKESRIHDKNDTKIKNYIEYITSKIDQDINILFSTNTVIKLDELLRILPENYQEKIKTYIDNKYNILKNKYPILIQYISNYSEKANYINAVANNFINDNTINYVLSLINKNKYLFNSMDFRLLNPDIMKMGNYFIDKTSRYPIISSKLIKIYETDINKYNLILNLSNKIRKENSDSIYDQKIELIIDYLVRTNINLSEEINDNLLNNLENYILDQTINPNSISYEEININNYTNDKNILLDKAISNCNDINLLKDFIYQRYFGLSQTLIEEFLLSYTHNWESVINLCNTSAPTKYIESLNKIKNILDINELKNAISVIPQYTISDYLNIKSIMVDTYNKAIIEDIKETNKGIKKKITINNQEIEVEDVTEKFGIFIHSTDAYGSMPLINNDYYESWNYNPNTKNHGICTSYITNSNYGTPLVKNNGVMFGFTNIRQNDIPLIAPYDLMTANEGYTIKSKQKPLFGRLQTISNYTRHTHNEASLERRVFDENGNSDLRQPDCIIIFEEMPEIIKENSIKAYEDFKRHGIELKIIYIDGVKNAQKEAKKINILITEYQQNHNLEILREIINRYESNICSSAYLGTTNKKSLNLFEQQKLFEKEKVQQLLFATAEHINNIEDINIKRNLFEQYLSILKEEQFKFKLIDDPNINRSRTFDLLNEKLKQVLEKIGNAIYSESQIIHKKNK